MKLSDYVVNFLVAEGVTHVFEVAGGAISHLLDSCYDRKDIKVISTHHEQAAAFAAEGYARASCGIGVAMATSGPGATNLITGIGSCFFDSVPALFITGQVNIYEFKNKKAVRQAGFQETDIVSIVKPIVKKAVMVKNPKMIKYYLEEAVFLAKAGRPGPVLIDIPLNIQRADINPKRLKSFVKRTSVKMVKDKEIEKIAGMIKRAKRPVVLAGGGVRLANAQEELNRLVDRTGVPVVSTLLGKDAFPNDSSNYAGMIGTYGNRFANLTIANADLLLILGARLDTRQTGTKPKTFAREATIIHVDIDPHELNNKVTADYPIQCDIKYFLSKLNPFLKGFDRSSIHLWKNSVNLYKDKFKLKDDQNKIRINPNVLMQKISKHLPAGTIVCADVGQHQMWAAQSLKLGKSLRFITQGGMGAMGSALSLGIGASFANPGKMVLVISGDGGFQLNIQELQTLYYYKLPIKIILLNNQCYGMVRQFQQQYFNSRFQSTVVGYSCPDFQEVVRAYRIDHLKLSGAGRIESHLKKIFSDRKPLFVEIEIDPKYTVDPKLSVDRPIEDQEPLLPREELRSLMIVKLYEK